MNLLYWLLCLIIGLVPAFFVFRKDRKRTIPIKWLPALLRFLTFFLTAALLLAPAFPHHKTVEDKPIVVWLQDQSSSIKNALGADTGKFQQKAKAILNASSKDYQIISMAFGTELTDQNIFNYGQEGTDISSALEDVKRRYQNQNLGAIILPSDGNYNIGNNPVYSFTDQSIPVYTIGLGDSTRPIDLEVSQARANKTVTLGNSFELTAGIHAEKLSGQSGTMRILHQGKVVGQQNFSIQNNAYNEAFRFYISADQKGLQTYTIQVNPLSGEQNLKNNQRTVTVNVLEKDVHIMIAAAAPSPDVAAIQEALKDNPEYKISVKYGSEIPANISGIDLLITHELPNKNGLKLPEVGNTPLWTFLGRNTNLAGFSGSQDFIKIQGGSGYTDVLPQLNTNFNYFPLPKDALSVTGQMPPLKAPSAQIKMTGGQSLFMDKNHAGQPLWAYKNGAKPVVVTLGTGLWRWRLYSYRFFQNAQTVDDLIQQTVSLLTQQSNSNAFQISLPKFQFQDKEPVQLNATLKDPSGALTNVPDAQLTITDSNGKKKEYFFNKSGKSYQLSLGNLPAGMYNYSGSAELNHHTFTDKGSFTIEAIPLEEMKTYSDFATLFKLSANTGGKFFTLNDMEQVQEMLKSNENMKPILRQETSFLKWVDLKWLFFLILLFATAEWVLRKYWGLQ